MTSETHVEKFIEIGVNVQSCVPIWQLIDSSLKPVYPLPMFIFLPGRSMNTYELIPRLSNLM